MDLLQLQLQRQLQLQLCCKLLQLHLSAPAEGWGAVATGRSLQYTTRHLMNCLKSLFLPPSSSFQTFKLSNFQTFQTFKLSNFQTFKLSNFHRGSSGRRVGLSAAPPAGGRGGWSMPPRPPAHAQERTSPTTLDFIRGRLFHCPVSLFFSSFFLASLVARCAGTRPQKNRIRHVGFFSARSRSLFVFFVFCLLCFVFFWADLAPERPKQKPYEITLKNHFLC